MTEIHFTINLVEIGKAVGYMVLGGAIVIAFILWLFRDWTPYR